MKVKFTNNWISSAKQCEKGTELSNVKYNDQMQVDKYFKVTRTRDVDMNLEKYF